MTVGRGFVVRRTLAASAMVGAFALLVAGSLAPPPQVSALASVRAGTTALVASQQLSIPMSAARADPVRDTYGATAGVQTLAAGGTNYDWAKLVLLKGGFPMTEENVTVMTRWMRQENGSNNWWNRNNPLNNGWGSGGNSGLGTYENLELAADNAAEALHSVSGYSAIVAALAASAPTNITEAAIWASPWASSHYANGGHWAYTPVDIVTSPEGTW